MSYRSLKRFFGETSLERKFRLLLGSSLIFLISSSFYWYAQRNLKVIELQYRQRAQLLIAQNLQLLHWVHFNADSVKSEASIREMSNQLKPENLREFGWKFIDAKPQVAAADSRPAEEQENEALRRLSKGEPYYVYEDRDNEDPLKNTRQYFEPIRAEESCLRCHSSAPTAGSAVADLTVPSPKMRVERVGDMLAVGKIAFPLSDTDSEVARNNALLLTLAIVTGFLAMTVAYVIVRYIIVKPVLHLKDVSDAVAHGDLDLRADIRTGDEFEELSHAFNRMLRHLVSIQDELRSVNSNLDHKVEELAQANLSLHEMNKLKSDFLSTMSHELRTPLNSILGFSDVLSGAEGLTDRQRKYIGNIQSSGKHLLMLINDILDLAKAEAGKMELHPAEFTVTDLIERAVSDMGPLAEKKNIELTTSIDPEIPIVFQDPGKLQQVLYNLISNAVKFTPEGGRIKVSALRQGTDRMDLIVADTGIGIPLDEQTIIFEKFRQGRSGPGQNGGQDESAMTRQYEGTGLGLSIVKELCRLLGGVINLSSEFGKGSTFTVTIPLHLDSHPTMESDSSTLPLEFRKAKLAALGIGIGEKAP